MRFLVRHAVTATAVAVIAGGLASLTALQAQTWPTNMTIGSALRALEPGAVIWQRYARRTAHVEVIGTLFNGEQERQQGSGLLVNADTVITNSHVALLESNYRSVVINVRLFDHKSQPVTARVVARDVQRDLAALRVDKPFIVGEGCPINARLDPPDDLSPGSSLFVMGFPVGQPLSIYGKGVLSNKQSRRWQTDVTLNPGNSGGPIFDQSLHLVGFGLSGVTSTIDGTRVVGVNFLVPLVELMASDVGKFVMSSNFANCWNTKFDAIELESSFIDMTKNLSNALPATMRRSYPLSFAFRRDSKIISQTLEPPANYRIARCELDRLAMRGVVDATCRVTGDNVAIVNATLKEPGPDSTSTIQGQWIGSAALDIDRRL